MSRSRRFKKRRNSWCRWRCDRAVAAQIVEAVSEHAIDAAIQAADQAAKADNEVRRTLGLELEEACYDAPWPPAATSSSIRPSVWSRANSKPAGTRRWSGSPISHGRDKAASPITGNDRLEAIPSECDQGLPIDLRAKRHGGIMSGDAVL
jgi:hypothetical protein